MECLFAITNKASETVCVASIHIGVRAPPDLGGGAVTFLPEKITQCPKQWGLKPGCKRRRSSFSHLMKLLSLEKIAQLKVCILNSINTQKGPLKTGGYSPF